MRTRLSVVAAALLVLGAWNSYAGQWTTKYGVKFETRSADWRRGKKVEWQRRITGKSGVTKINGVSWGEKVKGTAQTLANGDSVEHLTYTSRTGDVRQVTIKTLKDGKVIKTIKMADNSTRVITNWTEGGKKKFQVVDMDAQGAITSTKTDNGDGPQ